MRFVSDDGLFGFLLSPSGMQRFFRFQLVVGGELVGDSEPCIAGSAIGPLEQLLKLSDPRLDHERFTAAEVENVLSSDHQLNDASLQNFAESLDVCLVRAFIFHRWVNVLVTCQDPPLSRRAVVRIDEFEVLLKALKEYWANELRGGPSHVSET